ncbi:MAG: zinc transporter ZupT [Candidatus Cloacimonetes bacterium]|nr:zinc transporter ZupT [Candidatus Cloacimonadota bacterium]
MFDNSNILLAFSLTLFAGLSTGIGSLFAFYSKELKPNFLAASLGFSAGVMIYVSFMEILTKALESLSEIYGHKTGQIYTVIAFFVGIGIIALIDKLVPEYENPHEIKNLNKVCDDACKQKKLLRMGLFSAFAIGIHNFPEGLATFMAAMKDPALGISIAIAIAIHNIPEGIAVSVPIYFATKSKKRALVLSTLSGFAEPVGALLGYFLLRHFFTESTFGIIFALVAGIMVYISLDELLPTAEEYGKHHIAISGLILGMLVMAVSLIII